MRYLRLYAAFIRFAFSRAMEFRFDFYFRVLMDVVYYAVHLAFFQILFLHTPALGGWSLDQTLIFASAFLFTDALYMTLFASNFWMFPSHINTGSLDYYLIRPVSSLFFLTFRDFAANSFLNLIIAGGILIWSMARYPGELGAVNIAVFLAALLAGNAIHAMLSLIFLIPVFWMQGGMGLRELFFNVQIYAERPHQIYASWLRRILTSVLPLALIVSLPTHILFEGITWPVFLHFALVLAGVYAVLLLLWRLGLRTYGSASS